MTSTDVRAELEYMAKHVTPDEFRAAALAEVGRMQADLERLRGIEQRARDVETWAGHRVVARHILGESG